MARIRTIKPSFWSDGNVSRMSRETRLLVIGLISMADDAGRFPASQSAILGHVYPYDNVSPRQLDKWLSDATALHNGSELPTVALYEIDGRRYGFFPKWRKHQRINRPQPSTLPEPPQEGLW